MAGLKQSTTEEILSKPYNKLEREAIRWIKRVYTKKKISYQDAFIFLGGYDRRNQQVRRCAVNRFGAPITYDFTAGNYYWDWKDAQRGHRQAIETLRSMLVSMAKKFRTTLPSPSFPFALSGPMLDNLYRSLVSAGVVRHYLIAGTEDVDVPFKKIHEEARKAIEDVFRLNDKP